jgi:hypothetical protein
MTSATDLHIEVQSGEIVVTLPGTSFKVVYHKPPGSPQLMAKWYATRDKQAGQVMRAEFLAGAWQAANDKARELGWIV